LRTFVARVERGYPPGLDDYRNDLDMKNASGALLKDLCDEGLATKE